MPAAAATRFPANINLFSAMVGVGTQVLVIALAVFGLALVGMFYPYNRGAMLSACVVLYALTAGISGGHRRRRVAMRMHAALHSMPVWRTRSHAVVESLQGARTNACTTACVLTASTVHACTAPGPWPPPLSLSLSRAAPRQATCLACGTR